VFRPRLDTRIRTNDARPPEARRAEHPISFDTPPNSRGQADGRFNLPDRSPDVRRDTRIQNPARGTERAPADPQPDGRIGNRNSGQRPPDVRRDTRIQDRRIDRPSRPDPGIRNRPDIGRPGREQQISRPARPDRPMPARRPEMRQQRPPKPEAPRERGRDGQRGGR
jgi:hypothetical protein